MNLRLLAMIAAVASTSALGQASAAPPPVENPLASDAPSDAWEVARVRAPWTEPSGGGVSFGYDNGSWAGQWAQGIRVKFPIGRAFGLSLRGIYIQQLASEVFQGNLGGRIEFTGGTPVYLNLMRIYGGGGM